MRAEHAPVQITPTERSVLDQLDVAVIVTDVEGVVTHWNRHAEVMYGWSAEEAAGREVIELLVPAEGRESAGRIMDLVVGGGRWEGDIEILRKDGTPVLAHVADSLLYDHQGRPSGVIGVSFDVTGRRRAEEELARLLEAEQESRRQAETARQQLAFLAEAGNLLASSLDFAGTLQSLGGLAVSLLADACLVDVLDPDGSIRRMVAVHADPRMQELMAEMGAHPPDPEGANPAAQVIRTGRSEFDSEITEEFLRQIARDERHHRLIQDLGFMSYVCVPLIARGRVLGAMTLLSTNPTQRYGPADVALAEDLARRAALIIDNARLYDAEQEARHRAERAVERTTALQQVTAALSEALSSSEVAAVVLRHAAGQLGAAWGTVALVDGDAPGELRVVHAVGPGGLQAEAPHAPDAPLVEAVRTASALFFASPQELAERLPSAGERAERPPSDGGGAGAGAWAAVPLVVGGRPVGAVGLSFAEPGALGEEDLQFLQAMIRQGATALERARLYEAEQAARAEAEEGRRRLAFLAEASKMLAKGLRDYERTLSNVAHLAVPAFADWCTVDLLGEGDVIERVAIVHTDPRKRDLAIELQRRYPPDPEARLGVANVLRTGRPELASDISHEMLAAAAPDHEWLSIVAALGLRSSMVVPLTAWGRTLGAITFVSAESGRHYGEADLVLAQELAQRAAMAVDNARLFRERSHVARTLQQSLLPPQLPRIPRVEIAALYRPAGEGTEIGGDFYDLFETADQTWAVVIGDVCGKGADAAAVIGLVRYTVRALATQEREPSVILSMLNEALRQQVVDDQFCTVSYLRLQPDGDGMLLTVSCGGHPLPLVIRSSGAVETAGEPGTLLGVFPDPRLVDHTVRLEPGDALVLYTDGVVEERSPEGIMFGDARLAQTLLDVSGADAEGIATAIEREVTAFCPEAPRDDMAILVLRVTR